MGALPNRNRCISDGRVRRPGRFLFFAFFAALLTAGTTAAEPGTENRVHLGRLSVVSSPRQKTPGPRPRFAAESPPISFRDIGWRASPKTRKEMPSLPVAFLIGATPGAQALESPPPKSWNQAFISALGRRLLQEGASVHAVRDASRAREQGCPEMVSEFTWYDGDFREVSEARRDLVVDLVSGAAADTLEKTALGRWVRSLEALVERYSSVAYRRSSLAESGRFFLPGQAVPETPAAADAVAVTATTRLHLDSDDLAPEPELAVVAEYFHYQWHISLNPTQSEGSLFLSSKALDRILGVRVGMGISYDPKAEETAAGVVTLSGNF